CPYHPAEAMSRISQFAKHRAAFGPNIEGSASYPGEQPAIMDRALWERVQQQFKVDTRRRVRHRKVEALLSGGLYCAQCGKRMRSTYSSRQGRRHLYYVCRNNYVCRNKKADTKCQQQPVAAVDLETLLMEQLKRSFGCDFDMAFLANSLECASYDSRTREVGVTLADASQFAYTLPVAKRPGWRRTFENQAVLGRVPRVSRLMALALRFNQLLSRGAVRNDTELAQLGHVSRVRMCQILTRAKLAPTIQDTLLFPPKT